MLADAKKPVTHFNKMMLSEASIQKGNLQPTWTGAVKPHAPFVFGSSEEPAGAI
jgi:hypothetical protein